MLWSWSRAASATEEHTEANLDLSVLIEIVGTPLKEASGGGTP